MVVYCVVSGCKTLHDRNKPITFHSFPFKRPDVLKLWIEAINRDNWYPSKTSKICGMHFLPSDFQILPGCKRNLLKLEAVPSIFNFKKHWIEVINQKTPTEQITTISGGIEEIKTEVDYNLSAAMDSNMEQTKSTDDYLCAHDTKSDKVLDVNLPSTSDKITKRFVDAAVQTVENYNVVYSMRRKIKTLHQKINRKNLKIASMKKVIRKTPQSRFILKILRF